MKRLIIILVLFSAFSAGIYAQVSATATASATIVTPIAIANATNMNFGNVAVSASTAGTVILATDGSRTTGGAGGVTLPATAGTVSAASFSVTGSANYTYSISLPGGATTIDNNATGTMTVDTWTSNPTVGAGGNLGAGGAQTLYVGATLNVAAGQEIGAYSSDTPFSVTVNYN
jgi:hypothetical protein